MKDLFTLAQNGKMNALNQLYDDNKHKVYYVSYLLTGSYDDAKRAVIYAFSDIWEKVIDRQINFESEFANTVLNKGVFYCRSKILKNNPKAFKIPTNNNFLNLEFKKISGENKPFDITLKSLPDFQRFVYVLTYYAQFSKNKLAQLFKTNEEIISLILDSEKNNMNKICDANFATTEYTSNEFHNELIENENSVKCTDDVDELVAEKIREICEPFAVAKRHKYIISGIIASVIAVLVILLGFLILGNNGNSSTNSSGSTDTTLITDASGLTPTHYADIEIKDYGTITVALDGNIAPETVNNFVKLANEGFYNGLTFHRIIEGFMMQGGDPEGNGSGGSDQNVVGEFALNGYENNISHTRGAISMARANDYNSGSSQFFIVHKDSSTSLDGSYAAFGFVTEGIEIVDAVCEAAEPTDNNGTIKADEQPIITAITIRTK